MICRRLLLSPRARTSSLYHHGLLIAQSLPESLLFGLSFVRRQQEILSIYRDKMYHKSAKMGATSFLAPFQHQTNPEAITS